MRSFHVSPSYKRVAMGLYLIVCLIFLVKYLLRIGLGPCVFGCLVFLTAIAFLYVLSRRLSGWVVPAMLLYTAIAGVAIPLLFPPGTFEVDRWDMINVFTESLFSGNYPYAAEGITSGNNPAQSPFYFALCLPFQAAKWYVGLPLAGLWIYFLSTKKAYANNSSSTLLLLFSPFFIYETFTCSTIFFNASLVAAWLLWIKYASGRDGFFMTLHGIAGGLLLCTRNCFIIPVLLLGIMMLIRMRNKKLVILWGIVAILTFCLLYLPFVVGWGTEQWQAVNPFKVQSEVILSRGLMIALVAGTIVTGFFCRNFSHVLFCSGVWLFAASLLMMIETSVLVGFETAYFDSRVDITYFILALPFLLPFVDTGNTLDKLEQTI